MATPEPTPAATPQPTPAPTPEPTPAMTPEATMDSGESDGDGSNVLAPLVNLSAQPPTLDVSADEEACLTAALGAGFAQALAVPDSVTEEVSEAALGCLEEESILRLFLTPFLALTGPLSAESSECIRTGFGDTDYAMLMRTAAAQQGGQAGGEMAMMAGMTTMIVTLSCLDDDEFQKVAPTFGVAPGEREGFECVLEYLGGPEEMAALMSPEAGPPMKLFEALGTCQIQLAPGQ